MTFTFVTLTCYWQKYIYKIHQIFLVFSKAAPFNTLMTSMCAEMRQSDSKLQSS